MLWPFGTHDIAGIFFRLKHCLFSLQQPVSEFSIFFNGSALLRGQRCGLQYRLAADCQASILLLRLFDVVIALHTQYRREFFQISSYSLYLSLATSRLLILFKWWWGASRLEMSGHQLATNCQASSQLLSFFDVISSNITGTFPKPKDTFSLLFTNQHLDY